MGRINVISNSTSKQKVILQYYVYVRSQFLKTQPTDVNPIYQNFALPSLNNPEQTQHQCTLPTTCPPHNAYFFSRLDCKVYFIENILEFRFVSETIIIKFYLAFLKQLFVIKNAFELLSFNPVRFKILLVTLLLLQISQLLAFAQ